MPTKAELEAENRALRAEMLIRKNVLDEYKERVKVKAKEVAEEQGWCAQGVAEALKDLDIESYTTVDLTVSITVRLKVDEEIAEEPAAALLAHISWTDAYVMRHSIENDNGPGGLYLPAIDHIDSGLIDQDDAEIRYRIDVQEVTA